MPQSFLEGLSPSSHAPHQSTASREVTGQGLRSHTRPSTFHRDRSRWKLCPNPIGSDTPCHKPGSIKAGDSFIGIAVKLSIPRPAGQTPLLQGLTQGPPYALLREEEHAQPHPRCLPSADPPKEASSSFRSSGRTSSQTKTGAFSFT